ALLNSVTEAGHCSCRGGYSIGDCVAPVPVSVHRSTTSYGTTYYGTGSYGATIYRTSPRTVFYDWPSYGYRPYSFYRPYYGSGITISIGSGYRSPWGYSQAGYGLVPGYPSRYGIGRRSGLYFSFGSSRGNHRHRHHR
ncbi:MAG: hypothetical protein VB858_21125, partial [Planctomycetaceae bacterium]